MPLDVAAAPPFPWQVCISGADSPSISFDFLYLLMDARLHAQGTTPTILASSRRKRLTANRSFDWMNFTRSELDEGPAMMEPERPESP